MSISKSMKVEKEFFGEKTIILAKSGYGKSYTARVIIEEGIKLGNTFVIIDPQDAYLNLEGFAYVDITKVKSAKTMALVIASSNKNVVIQVKKVSVEDQNKFVKTFLEEYRLHLRKGIHTIVIDELHKFAPESEKTDAKEVIRGMCQENRSDGLGLIGISQRPQRIDKTCLSQADNLCIGRVTSYRDKESMKAYLDNPEDLDKIKTLKKGEFYFYGFGLEEPIVEQVRESESKHSGSSPKDLLNEDRVLFDNHVKKFYKGDTQMAEAIPEGQGVIGKIIPTKEGFTNLAVLGMKMSLGMATSGLVGGYVGSKFQSPIPVISARTLGAGASTLVLYTGYRMLPDNAVKDVVKYATAGSTIFTAGSLVGDLIVASKIQMPNFVNAIVGLSTGASPMVSDNKTDSGNVDLNTNFS